MYKTLLTLYITSKVYTKQVHKKVLSISNVFYSIIIFTWPINLSKSMCTHKHLCTYYQILILVVLVLQLHRGMSKHHKTWKTNHHHSILFLVNSLLLCGLATYSNVYNPIQSNPEHALILKLIFLTLSPPQRSILVIQTKCHMQGFSTGHSAHFFKPKYIYGTGNYIL